MFKQRRERVTSGGHSVTLQAKLIEGFNDNVKVDRMMTDGTRIPRNRSTRLDHRLP